MYYETNCKTCPKKVNCCINGFAFLTPNDAKNIKERIKKDFDYFLDYSQLPKQIVANLKDEDPSLEGSLRYSQLDKYKVLRLKKKDGKCIFLDDAKKCKIYDIRPNICRIYPFWAMRLLNGKIKVIEHDIDMECSVVKGKSVDDVLDAKGKEEIKKVFEDIEKENETYEKSVRRFVEEL